MSLPAWNASCRSSGRSTSHCTRFKAPSTGLARHNLLRELSRADFIDAATDLLANLNALHPFREGNGRTQRAFVSQFAEQAGHGFRWPGDAEQRNKDASIEAMRGDNTALHALVSEPVRGAEPHSRMRETPRIGPGDP